jgi:hypothetical protein
MEIKDNLWKKFEIYIYKHILSNYKPWVENTEIFKFPARCPKKHFWICWTCVPTAAEPDRKECE